MAKHSQVKVELMGVTSAARAASMQLTSHL
jgi:hypothetical protein